MLNKEEIREASDIGVIAEALGIPISFTNKRKPQILCPCHDDHHFGSCSLDLQKKTFYCYSCSARGDVFALVQAVKHCSFVEAEEFVANECGGVERYLITDAKVKQTMALSKKCIPKDKQELIGLHNEPVYEDVAFYGSEYDMDDEQKSKAVPVYDDNGIEVGYRIRRCVMSNPLYTLLQDDEEMYRTLIDSFCQKTIDGINLIISHIKSGDDWGAFGCFLSTIKAHIPYEEAISELTEMIREVQNISVTYGNGEAIQTSESPYIEKISKFVNSIWLQNEGAPF